MIRGRRAGDPPRASRISRWARPAIWGIVNVTPDSFSDGGAFEDAEGAIAHGAALVAAGADVLDIGGESTRPGATAVAPGEEQARVLPVLAGLRAALPDVPLSIDTRRAEVARAALAGGATIVNDVSGGRDPAMFDTVAQAGAGLVLMHMRGVPATMQQRTNYTDVVREVHAYLLARRDAAVAAGVATIWLDPGIGFGKTVAHNVALIQALAELRAAGGPVLLGASRKSFLGTLTDESRPERRVAASLACAAFAASQGVDAVRVHDVAETHAHLRVLATLLDV